jgi:transposase InsO family protein
MPRIRHLLIEKPRPQTNGKVERYQQTLKRERALGQLYRSSQHRAAALSHWLEHYNTRRPHSSLGGLPPISRVHNVPRQVTEAPDFARAVEVLRSTVARRRARASP